MTAQLSPGRGIPAGDPGAGMAGPAAGPGRGRAHPGRGRGPPAGSGSLCGFEAEDLALDRAGIGALLRDRMGRVMLLKRHGAHFAARLLDSHSHARLDRNFLTIGSGESTFGKVTLDLGDKAQVWASSLRRLGS